MDRKIRNISESQLIERISTGDKEAFEILFFDYYKQLCRFALNITKCNELARDAVQDVFFKIWKTRDQLIIQYSLKAYLYQAVRNQSLNLYEHSVNHRSQWQNQIQPIQGENLDRKNIIELDPEKLILKVWEIVEQMPDQRKQVFELHKKHGLSYQEISEVMDIAQKTVENHMGRALKELREMLR